MNANLWQCEGDQLPVFLGLEWKEFVDTWRELAAAGRKVDWMLAAIAGSMERAAGGRPEAGKRPKETVVQKFCKDVGIHRQTFHRYARTYRIFSKTSNTGVTSCDRLSFKHFAVAAQSFDVPEDAVKAVVEARDKGWSANEFARQLAKRLAEASGPDPAKVFSRSRAFWKLLSYVESWPFEARSSAPRMLRYLADQIEQRWHLADDGDDDLSQQLADDPRHPTLAEQIERRRLREELKRARRLAESSLIAAAAAGDVETL